MGVQLPGLIQKVKGTRVRVGVGVRIRGRVSTAMQNR